MEAALDAPALAGLAASFNERAAAAAAIAATIVSFRGRGPALRGPGLVVDSLAEDLNPFDFENASS